MSYSSLIIRRHMRIAVVVAMAVVLAAVAWIVGPQRADSVAPAAAPANARIGTLTFTGFSTTTVDLTAFNFAATAEPCSTGGGGCSGRSTVADPAATLDTDASSPPVIGTLLAGEHLPKLTVVLFKPFTTQRAQEFVFEEVTFTSVQVGTAAPNNAEPKQNLTWNPKKVTYRVYKPGTTQVLSETCWDVAANRSC